MLGRTEQLVEGVISPSPRTTSVAFVKLGGMVQGCRFVS